METLNPEGFYISGGNIKTSFENLKTVLCGDNGLKGQEEILKRSCHFSYLKLEKNNATAKELFDAVPRKHLNEEKIDTFIAVIKDLEKSKKIGSTLAVKLPI